MRLPRGRLPLAVGSLALLLSEPAAGSGIDVLEPDVSIFPLFDAEGAVSVAPGGDLNGDGFADFAIGAYNNGYAHTSAGRIYIYFGGTSGWETPLYLEQSADASLLGEAPADQAGRLLDGGHDVNGDGLDDLLIAARYNDEGATDAGQVYLVFGTADDWPFTSSLDQADASFLGESAGDYTGPLALTEDVNGDGFADILIMAPYNSENGDDAGKAHLIFGKGDGWSRDTPLADSDVVFLGADDDHVNHGVAGIGDVDGDGLGDLLFLGGGEIQDVWLAEAYLYLGRNSGWVSGAPTTSWDASFFVWNEGIYSAAGAGDVNGDGIDDFLVGCWAMDHQDITPGKVFLYFGRPSGWSLDVPITQADATFVGEGDYDSAGRAVAGLGDIDGDGFDDFAIGAPNNDEHYGENGQAYLIRGRASGWGWFDMPLTFADASIISPVGFPLGMGYTLAGPGDVNGDGYDDVLVGASALPNFVWSALWGADYLTFGFPCWDTDRDGVESCAGDCDDHQPLTHLGAEELCDGTDNDCDGQPGDDEVDADSDGWMVCDGDCDDTDPEQTVPPETNCGDGADNDCDGDIDDLDDDCVPGDDDSSETDDDDSTQQPGDEGCECRAGTGRGWPSDPTALLALMVVLALRNRRPRTHRHVAEPIGSTRSAALPD